MRKVAILMATALMASETAALASIRQARADGLRPDVQLSVSAWADAYRRLPSKSSAEPGPWRTDRTPYLRDIMDDMSTTSEVEEVIVMKAAQVGASEAILNVIGYVIDHAPGPAIIVQPTELLAKRFSRQRLEPLVTVTPRVAAKVAPSRSRDSGNTVLPLAVDTVIPTPRGWTTMGAIAVGDQVFDEQGHVANVMGTSEVMYGRMCYRVAFSDGSAIVADADHLWPVESWMLRRVDGVKTQTNVCSVLTTAEIAGRVRKAGRSRYAIRVAAPLELPTVDLPVDPYVLGVWLGDGFSHRAWICTGKQDSDDIRDNLIACGVTVTTQSYQRAQAPTTTLVLDRVDKVRNAKGQLIPTLFGVPAGLRQLGLIGTIGDSRKAIPQAYLRASIQQREALLQGLMDTDGHIRRRGGWCVFTTTSPTIAEGVADLLSGLGLKWVQKHRPSSYRKADGSRKPCKSAITFSFMADQSRPVFKLARKRARQVERLTSRATRRRIIAVEEVASVQVRCISVDSPGRLFLAGQTMIPTHNSKEYPGGQLILTGANSAVGLRSMPAQYALMDEVDGYPIDVDEEGSPIALVEARQRTFARRKRMKVSTPTIAGRSAIEAAYEASDQRRYYVPCPDCGEMQPLEFTQLTWSKLGLPPSKAVYECRACFFQMQEKHKTEMLAAGEWRPEQPDRVGKIRGYHLNALYTPVGWFSWGEIATQFADVHRDPERLRVFINTVLGEAWAGKGEAPAWEGLVRRREDYAIGTVPEGAVFLTCGVDVQKDRVVYEVVGWGRGKRSWSVDYGELPGETADLHDGPWAQVDELLARSYPHVSGVPMPIRMLAVDSGYNTQTVYTWARQYPMNRVVAVKGQDYGGVLVGSPTPVEITDRGRKSKRGGRVWPVCVSMAKGELYGWLRLEVPIDGSELPPGFCHFPQYGDEYFKQLTAEQVVAHKTRKGFIRLEWELIPGRQNHVLDARVYARAAASLAGLDRFTESDWAARSRLLAVAPITKSAAPAIDGPPAPSGPPRKPGGWLGRTGGPGRTGGWLKKGDR